MSVKLTSAAIVGLDASPVDVEVDAVLGLHSFSIVGLPDKTVDESKDRIGSAIKNSGFIAPIKNSKRIVVNLAPANIKKEGSSYDLPIALGYLLATGQIKAEPDGAVFIGELSLDGSLKKVNGILPIAQMAKKSGFTRLILPEYNAKEASFVGGIEVLGVSGIKQAVDYLTGQAMPIYHPPVDYESFARNKINQNIGNGMDLSDVRGQETAKRAMIVAASGAHNIIMSGPPGGGKTILARAFQTILPVMNEEEALEVSKIYSIAGLIKNEPIITARPFRNPHHTTSSVAVIGGGTWPRPGEITLAHRGVLFMDELPEFPRNVLEALRQPLENGEVVVARASGAVRFPARFIMIAAMNPCPCGNYGSENLACSCSAGAILKYKKKISGPILDRIDVQINVSRETYDKMSMSSGQGMTSAQAASIVARARALQSERLKKEGILTNSEMGIKQIDKYCLLEPEAEELIKNAFMSHNLSGRGYHKILKIARTIADIDASDTINAYHTAEAIGYRVRATGEVSEVF